MSELEGLRNPDARHTWGVAPFEQRLGRALDACAPNSQQMSVANKPLKPGKTRGCSAFEAQAHQCLAAELDNAPRARFSRHKMLQTTHQTGGLEKAHDGEKSPYPPIRVST